MLGGRKLFSDTEVPNTVTNFLFFPTLYEYTVLAVLHFQSVSNFSDLVAVQNFPDTAAVLISFPDTAPVLNFPDTVAVLDFPDTAAVLNFPDTAAVLNFSDTSDVYISQKLQLSCCSKFKTL